MATLEQANAAISRAYDHAARDFGGDWSEVFHKPDFIAYRKKTDTELYALKFDCWIAQSPRQIIDTLFDNWIDYNRQINASEYIEGRVVHRYDPDTVLTYERFTAPVPFISDRDMVVASSRRQVSDNTWIKVDASVVHPSYPDNYSIVRAELTYAVHICEGQPDGSTKMQVIGLGDPKGRIPKIIVNFGLTRRVKTYYKLINRLKEA